MSYPICLDSPFYTDTSENYYKTSGYYLFDLRTQNIGAIIFLTVLLNNLVIDCTNNNCLNKRAFKKRNFSRPTIIIK